METLPRIVIAVVVVSPLLVCIIGARVNADPCSQTIGSDSGACIDMTQGCAKWGNELECVQHIGPSSSQTWNRKCEGQGGPFDHCRVLNVDCAKQANCEWSQFGCEPGALVDPEAWYQTPKAVLGGTCTSGG